MTSDELIPLALGALLARRRIEKKLTQAQLAKRLGCTQSTIAKVEAGQRVRLNVGDLWTYAAVLGTQPHKLLKGAQDVVTLAHRVAKSVNYVDLLTPVDPAALVPVLARHLIIP